MSIVTTHSSRETQDLAAVFARMLAGGEHISLIGDLGAGKTTFIQGLVAALGSSARVKSPTFTVMNEYVITGHPTIKKVVHCDFYRFSSPEEIRALELEVYDRSDTVVIAEWPNILPDMRWNADIEITLTHQHEDSRQIEIVSKN